MIFRYKLWKIIILSITTQQIFIFIKGYYRYNLLPKASRILKIGFWLGIKWWNISTYLRKMQSTQSAGQTSRVYLRKRWLRVWLHQTREENHDYFSTRAIVNVYKYYTYIIICMQHVQLISDTRIYVEKMNTFQIIEDFKKQIEESNIVLCF